MFGDGMRELGVEETCPQEGYFVSEVPRVEKHEREMKEGNGSKYR
jgi:hypothetical protein